MAAIMKMIVMATVINIWNFQTMIIIAKYNPNDNNGEIKASRFCMSSFDIFATHILVYFALS